MLILDRVKDEEILIGDDIRIVVREVTTRVRESDGLRVGHKVYLGITAPKRIKIIRPDAIKQEKDHE